MKKITIYTGPLCNYCEAAKRLLTRNNAPFNEINIATVDGAMDEMIKKAIDLKDCGGIPALDAEIERLKELYKDETVNDSDGLRIDFDEGWLHVRASNTEPIARVIAEASDSLTAFKLANRVKL